MNIEELESLLEEPKKERTLNTFQEGFILRPTLYNLPDYLDYRLERRITPFPYTSVMEVKEDVAGAIQDQVEGRYSATDLRLTLSRMLHIGLFNRFDYWQNGPNEMTLQIEYTDSSREEYYLRGPF